MPKSGLTNSPPHPQGRSSIHDTNCSCGHSYLAKAGDRCPNCGVLASGAGAEFVRKTFDEPDLKKGF